MPKRSSSKALEAERLLRTAEKIRGRTKNLPLDALACAARLSLVRAAFAARLAPALGPDASVRAAWDKARSLEYPLFSPSLDPAGAPDAGPDEDLALPDGALDPADIFERLLEIELSLSARGKRLSLASGRAGRRKQGTFYTPAWLAERLARRVVEPLRERKTSSRPLHILDPACGAGRLLLAAQRALLADAPEGERRERAREAAAGLCGVDLDATAVALAASLVQLEADPLGPPIPGLARQFVAGDSLTGPLTPEENASAAPPGALAWRRAFPEALEREGGGFDVVLSNPPFEVLKDLRDPAVRALVERVRALSYRRSLCGNLNLSRLFLDRALELLAPGGRLGFVLPLSFLMDRTAARLREPLVRSGWLEGVEAYPETARVFDGVSQAVVLLWLEKRARRSRIEVSEEGPAPRRAVFSNEEIATFDPKTFALPLCQAADMDLALRLSRQSPVRLGDFFEGRVGEVDQTFFRPMMKSEPTSALLLRGAHLAPFAADLSTKDREERWLDAEAFAKKKGGGSWRLRLAGPRIVQTGIVNREAARRFVAAEVPAGIYLGNSLNTFWPRAATPLSSAGLDDTALRGYLLGLLNSAPLEWRFRLSSSNNNINLYEVLSLPLPHPVSLFPAERLSAFLGECLTRFELEAGRQPPLSAVRRVTSGWGSPSRDDRATAALIGTVARRRAAETDPERILWWDHLLDHLVNWHLGLDEPDLERMLLAMPDRSGAGKKKRKGV